MVKTKTLTHPGSNRYWVVTDRRTDRRTELPQLIHAIAMLALARKKQNKAS